MPQPERVGLEPEPEPEPEPIPIFSDPYRIVPSQTMFSEVQQQQQRRKREKTKGAATIISTATYASPGQGYNRQLPTQKGLLSERELKQIHPNCYDGFKDPLAEDEKRILHENYRRESATRRSLDFLCDFTLGERTELTMRPTTSFASQAREDAEVKSLNEDPSNLDLLDQLATIDENVGFNDALTALFTSGRHFGRAVLVKQYDKDGIPIRLIPLASVKLGKVYVDAETWELLGIEYKDYEGERRILKVEDIIHYEANDYHITPNSRYFGYSDSETVLHIAASLRITNEIAIPEMRTQSWAPLDILQFPDVQTQETLDLLKAQIKPGKRLVLGKGSVVHTKVDIQGDLEKTLKSVEESTKQILRAYGVPLVIAFQDEQNRSTAQYSLNQFKVSVLEKHRTKLRNVLEPQWYIPNLKALMRKRQNQRQAEPIEEEQEGIIPALERSAAILEIDPEALQLPFKPKMLFMDKSFDTFLEKSAAMLGWIEAIGSEFIPMALEKAGLTEFIEPVKIMLENKRVQQALQPQPQPQPQSQPTSSGGPRPGTALTRRFPIATGTGQS